MSTVLQLLRVASEGVFTSFGLDGRVRSDIPLSVAICSETVSLINFLQLRKMIFDSHYDLAVALMDWKTMEAHDWIAVSNFPVAQWEPHDFVREKLSFLTLVVLYRYPFVGLST